MKPEPIKPAEERLDVPPSKLKWYFRCVCGVMFVRRLDTGGLCGCGRRRHGLTETREYRIWSNIKSRTSNPNNDAFENYGGRGIKMSEAWGRLF